MSPKAAEHPLMSNRTLRAMFTSLVAAQAHLPTGRRRPVLDDTACWVAPLAALATMDAVFGCRADGLLEDLRPERQRTIANPRLRLYAAIGAAMSSNGKPPQAVILAFFERHEITGKDWPEALALAAPLPLVLVVLPRAKGREDALDLGKLARVSGVPSIPVDSQDAIALYRVAQESILRARNGGGAALLEAIHLDAPPAIEKLAAYLTLRGIASQSWIDRNGSNLIDSSAKRK